jgi:2-hydroxy-3-keto-5-methylthiopentenyl-1-phosphate phosphatase
MKSPAACAGPCESTSRGGVAVLCDFDGTICKTETLGFLFREFAACGMEHVLRWERGEIDMREEIRATFDTIRASKEQMEQSLDTLQIDLGFLKFLDLGRRRGYRVAILSDGLDWYIQYILRRYGVVDIPIFANRVFFENGGFRFEFPWFHEETARRGVCKRRIARTYRERCARVVFVGDGRSDVDVVGEVDLVFARGWLAGYCSGSGLRAVEFHDWEDLIAKWTER